MKMKLAGAGLLVAFALPALAQDLETLTCLEYGEMDNAGQMAMVAELEAAASQMDTQMTSAEIQDALTEHCGGAPEVLVIDVLDQG